MRARVSATYLYPVKACAPLAVTSLAFGPAGEIRGDREWVVVDADDRITWQGTIPALSRILPLETPDGLAITSTAGPSAILPPPGQGQPRQVQSWNSQRQAFDTFAGHDAGDAVADFASAIAGQTIRLVQLSTTNHRPNPVHIISTASVVALTSELERDTDLRRFRPNVVLAGDGDVLPPFVEEQVASLVRSSPNSPLVLAITGPCERCVVINVDPASGSIDNRYLKTTAAHSQRRQASTPVAFGIYARATTPGTLATGDRLELIFS